MFHHDAAWNEREARSWAPTSRHDGRATTRPPPRCAAGATELEWDHTPLVWGPYKHRGSLLLHWVRVTRQWHDMTGAPCALFLGRWRERA